MKTDTTMGLKMQKCHQTLTIRKDLKEVDMNERLVIKEGSNGEYYVYHRRYENGEAIDTLITNEKDINRALKVAKNIIETVESIFHKSLLIEVEIYE